MVCVRKAFLLILLLTLLSSASVQAGTAFTAYITDFRHGGVRYPVPVVTEGRWLKADTTHLTGGRSRTELIYDGSQGIIWYVDHGERSYVQIDERTVSAVSDNVNAARNIIEEKMVRVGLLDGSGRQAKLELRKTGDTVELGGIQCAKYLGVRGKATVQEILTAPWDKVGLAPASFVLPRQLLDAYDRIMPSMGGNPLLGDMEYVPMTAASQAEGYPMLLAHFEGGKLVFRMQLGFPSAQAVSPSTFNVPSDYQRKRF